MQFRIFGFWRLFAAFLVMSYHFAHYGPQGFEAVLQWFERLLPLLDMFFMISGFLIFHRYHDRVSTMAQYKGYLIKRLARLYPLHLMTTGFFIFVGLAVGLGFVQSYGTDGGLQRYDWAQIPSNLLLTQAWGTHNALTFNYVSWSVSAEWFCYLLFPIIAYAARIGGVKLLFGLLFVVVLLLEIAVQTKFMPFPSWMMASTWGAYRAFADFVVGAIVAKLVMETAWTIASPWPAWTAMAVACVFMQLGMSRYMIFGILGLALLLAAISEQNAPERSKWLDVFGPIANVSFGLYLWHPVVEAVLLSFTWRRFIEPLGIINFYAFMLIPMALTIIIALASFRLIEKPANSWILSKAGFKAPKSAIIPAAVA